MLNITFPFSGYYATSFKYPAGEWQVRLTEQGLSSARTCGDGGVRVAARVKSSDDLMQVILLGDAIKAVTGRKSVLYLPYLPYGRADRRFQDGDCAGLDVFEQLLTPYYTISTLDKHSTTPLVQSFNPKLPLKEFAFGRSRKPGCGVAVMFPDKGAFDRYSGMVGEYAYKPETRETIALKKFYCTKSRDADGKITQTSVPLLDGPYDILVIDDICDGGATFKILAENLRKLNGPNVAAMSLYVTHGIFSKGVETILEDYDHIYTTDSYYDGKSTDRITVAKV